MNPIFYWNAVLLEASRRDFTRGFNNAQQPGPIRTSRAMAIVHIAMHDALAILGGAPSYLARKYPGVPLPAPGGGTIPMEAIEGAAVTALKAMYPKFHEFIDDATHGAATPSFNFGGSVANALLAPRGGDGHDRMMARPQAEDLRYGDHRADPYTPNQMRLGVEWGNVERFTNPAHQPLAPFPGAVAKPAYPHGEEPLDDPRDDCQCEGPCIEQRWPPRDPVKTPNNPHGDKYSGDLLGDPDYRVAFEEVRERGAKARNRRTAEQERIGVYWGYDGAMNLGVPPRLYNQIARTIVLNQPIGGVAPGAAGYDLALARLFMLINVAMADAGIDAWHWKYCYNLWRPVVGIRAEKGPKDGDPFWAPLGAPQTNSSGITTRTPDFPAYPSGHATFGAAMFQVLRLAFLNGGAISVADVLQAESAAEAEMPEEMAGEMFSFVSDELNGVSMDPDGSVRPRVEKAFGSYAEAIWENAVSRVYLGVHWRFDGLPPKAVNDAEPDADGLPPKAVKDPEDVGGVGLGNRIGERPSIHLIRRRRSSDRFMPDRVRG